MRNAEAVEQCLLVLDDRNTVATSHDRAKARIREIARKLDAVEIALEAAAEVEFEIDGGVEFVIDGDYLDALATGEISPPGRN